MLKKSISVMMLAFVACVSAQAQDTDEVDGDYLVIYGDEVAPPSWAVVDFSMDRPQMNVATILSNSVASGGGYTAVATHYQDLCLAPCRLAIKPGLRKFSAYGAGRVPGLIQMDLRPNMEYTVRGKTGSIPARLGGYGLATLGLTAVTLGAIFWASEAGEFGDGNTGPWIGTTVGGVAALGLGFGLMLGSKTKMEQSAGRPR